MNPQDIPPSLKKILDERAGKEHSQTGPVMTALAEILTLHERMLGRKGKGEIEKLLEDAISGYREHLHPDAIAHVQADFSQLLDYWSRDPEEGP